MAGDLSGAENSTQRIRSQTRRSRLSMLSLNGGYLCEGQFHVHGLSMIHGTGEIKQFQ
jgi:hypothetical protein